MTCCCDNNQLLNNNFNPQASFHSYCLYFVAKTLLQTTYLFLCFLPRLPDPCSSPRPLMKILHSNISQDINIWFLATDFPKKSFAKLILPHIVLWVERFFLHLPIKPEHVQLIIIYARYRFNTVHTATIILIVLVQVHVSSQHKSERSYLKLQITRYLFS